MMNEKQCAFAVKVIRSMEYRMYPGNTKIDAAIRNIQHRVIDLTETHDASYATEIACAEWLESYQRSVKSNGDA